MGGAAARRRRRRRRRPGARVRRRARAARAPAAAGTRLPGAQTVRSAPGQDRQRGHGAQRPRWARRRPGARADHLLLRRARRPWPRPLHLEAGHAALPAVDARPRRALGHHARAAPPPRGHAPPPPLPSPGGGTRGRGAEEGWAGEEEHRGAGEVHGRCTGGAARSHRAKPGLLPRARYEPSPPRSALGQLWSQLQRLGTATPAAAGDGGGGAPLVEWCDLAAPPLHAPPSPFPGRSPSPARWPVCTRLSPARLRSLQAGRGPAAAGPRQIRQLLHRRITGAVTLAVTEEVPVSRVTGQVIALLPVTRAGSACNTPVTP